MAVTNHSFRFDLLRDDAFLDQHLKGKTGIYVWSLFPTYNSVKRLMPLLANMTTNRVVSGRDDFSDRNVSIQIQAETGVVENEGWNLSEEQIRGDGASSLIAHLGRFLAPPIYIGKSFGDMHNRIKSHRKAINRAYNRLSLSDDIEDLEARTFAERLRVIYNTLGEELDLKPDDFGVHVFLIEDPRLTNKELEIIENDYIKAFWPIGNKKVIK